ncbi:hypothetical protein Lepto7376_2370 [[Leptolyngbya] sp. PCC 7376]|nr:hypothetical protein Lepto7376_2370 [[Leptolyngbya] sp. PCC 7376]
MILVMSSDTIYTYINVLCNARFAMGIEDVIFLHITGISTGIRADQAEDLKKDIQNRIEELAKTQKIYAQLQDSINFGRIIKIQDKNIGYDLAKLVRKLSTSNKYIIDITPTTKAASQLVLAACLVNGLRNLYEFHLYKRIERNNPLASLYHNLNQSDFKYVHLSEEPALREAYDNVKRKNILSLLAIVISIIILLLSVIFNMFSRISIASLLSAVASLATIVSLGLQFSQTRHT